jgi:hypothetical protein
VLFPLTPSANTQPANTPTSPFWAKAGADASIKAQAANVIRLSIDQFLSIGD